MLGNSPVWPATSFVRHIVVVNARIVLLLEVFDLTALATERSGRARTLGADMLMVCLSIW
jgi:hypothetical protein